MHACDFVYQKETLLNYAYLRNDVLTGRRGLMTIFGPAVLMSIIDHGDIRIYSKLAPYLIIKEVKHQFSIFLHINIYIAYLLKSLRRGDSARSPHHMI